MAGITASSATAFASTKKISPPLSFLLFCAAASSVWCGRAVVSAPVEISRYPPPLLPSLPLLLSTAVLHSAMTVKVKRSGARSGARGGSGESRGGGGRPHLASPRPQLVPYRAWRERRARTEADLS